MNKIGGIGLSLCLSLRLLYKLSLLDKPVTCTAVMESKSMADLTQFFFPYNEYGDRSVIKQIKQAIKLIFSCSENSELHQTLLDREIVSPLVKVGETLIDEDFSDFDYRYNDGFAKRSMAAKPFRIRGVNQNMLN